MCKGSGDLVSLLVFFLAFSAPSVSLDSFSPFSTASSELASVGGSRPTDYGNILEGYENILRVTVMYTVHQ
jgi:hypothetical protein